MSAVDVREPCRSDVAPPVCAIDDVAGGERAPAMIAFYASLIVEYHGKRAIQEGYSPRALHAFLQGVQDLRLDRNKRFFSRLANVMRTRFPTWGDDGKRKTSSTKSGNSRSHSSHLS